MNRNNSGDGTAGSVGLRVYVYEAFALGADASFDSNETTYMLGARFDFGHP